MNDNEILISSSFKNDLNETMAILNSASSNYGLTMQNVSGLSGSVNVETLPTTQSTPPKTADQLKAELESVCKEMEGAITNASSVFLAIVVSLGTIVGIVEDIEDSNLSDTDKINAITDAMDQLTDFNDLISIMTDKNMLLDTEAYNLWKEYFSGKTDLDFEGFIKKLQETIETDSELANDVKEKAIKCVTKFSQKVLNNTFKEAVENHFGSYGMTIINALEGYALNADADLFTRLGEAFKIKTKQFLEKTVTDEVENNFGDAFLKEAFLKEASTQAFAATAALNLVVSLSADMVKGELSLRKGVQDVGHSIISATAGILGTTVGTLNPLVGIGVGVVVDVAATWAYDSFHNYIWDNIEEQQHYENFSLEDINKIRSSAGEYQGIVDDEKIPPGTTIYDVSRKLVEYGYPSVVADLITGNKDFYIMENGRETVDTKIAKMCLQNNKLSAEENDKRFKINLGTMEAYMKNEGYTPEELAEFKEGSLELREKLKQHPLSKELINAYERSVIENNHEGEAIYDELQKQNRLEDFKKVYDSSKNISLSGGTFTSDK